MAIAVNDKVELVHVRDRRLGEEARGAAQAVLLRDLPRAQALVLRDAPAHVPHQHLLQQSSKKDNKLNQTISKRCNKNKPPKNQTL